MISQTAFVKQVDRSLLKEWLEEKITATANDIRQTFKKDDLNHIVNRLSDILYFDFPQLQVIQVENIFTGIIYGVYGDNAKLSVRDMIKHLKRENNKSYKTKLDEGENKNMSMAKKLEVLYLSWTELPDQKRYLPDGSPRCPTLEGLMPERASKPKPQASKIDSFE